MNDGILSQEEIDALLRGDSPASSSETPASLINDFEKDTLGEIGNISMGTAATTLSTLLRKKVSITTPEVIVSDRHDLANSYEMPYVVVEVQYRQGLTGSNILVIKEHDAGVIADLMMGGDGQAAADLADDIMLSAVGEAMNQMVGSATTSLSSMFNQRIDIAPPLVNVSELEKELMKIPTSYNEVICVKFKMEIEGLVNSECMQIIPVEAVRDMIAMAMGNSEPEIDLESILEPSAPTAKEPVAAAPPTPAPPPPIQPQAAAPPPMAAAPASPVEPVYAPAADVWANPAPSASIRKDQQYAVQPVQFAPVSAAIAPSVPQNIGLIMDVPLDVSVELGKTRKTIKEILELQQGSIIQLDKMAGEPVDLLVNGKLIAKGEVVVIDENYGIRITTIISPMDRVSRLQ
ncbi:MAG: flagellar motor switch phosphatase FliY [Syntrophomonadaceae bacterium]